MELAEKMPRTRSIGLWYLFLLLGQGFFICYWTYRLGADIDLFEGSARRVLPQIKIAISSFAVVIMCTAYLVGVSPDPGSTVQVNVFDLGLVSAAVALLTLIWSLMILNRKLISAMGKNAEFTDDLMVLILAVLFFSALPYLQSKLNNLIRLSNLSK